MITVNCANPDCRKQLVRTPGRIQASGNAFCDSNCYYDSIRGTRKSYVTIASTFGSEDEAREVMKKTGLYTLVDTYGMSLDSGRRWAQSLGVKLPLECKFCRTMDPAKLVLNRRGILHNGACKQCYDTVYANVKGRGRPRKRIKTEYPMFDQDNDPNKQYARIPWFDREGPLTNRLVQNAPY